MAKSNTLLRAFIRAAVLQSDELGGTNTPTTILNGLILGKFRVEATNGKTLISTQEAGGGATFVIPDLLGSADVMELAELALEWLGRQEDPNDPDLGKLQPVRRLRPSFDHIQPAL